MSKSWTSPGREMGGVRALLWLPFSLIKTHTVSLLELIRLKRGFVKISDSQTVWLSDWMTGHLADDLYCVCALKSPPVRKIYTLTTHAVDSTHRRHMKFCVMRPDDRLRLWYDLANIFSCNSRWSRGLCGEADLHLLHRAGVPGDRGHCPSSGSVASLLPRVASSSVGSEAWWTSS